MNLALDIGNTHIKYALFKGRDLLESGCLELPASEDQAAGTQKWEELCNLPIERIIYSSVRKHFEWEQLLHLPKGIKPIRLQADTPLPIRNHYHTPETLGRLDAMNYFTDGLPRPKEKRLPSRQAKGNIGKTTEEALLLGALQGAIFEIQGFIAACEGDYGPLKILMTGGDASFLADKLKREIFVLPNLVLRGLNEILLHNV